MNIIGIDPGLNGAVVVIDESHNILDWYDTPIIKSTKGKTGYAIAEMGRIFDSIISHGKCLAYIEAQQAMPKQGLSSTFKIGFGYGLWTGIVMQSCTPYVVVAPKTWQKQVLMGAPGDDTKAKSMTVCQRLFPRMPLTTPHGKKCVKDGRADAALIAFYGLVMQNATTPITAWDRELTKTHGVVASKV